MIKQMRNSTQRFNKQTEFALTIESLSYTKGNDDAKEANGRMGNSALCISIPISEILLQIVKLMSTIQFMRSERKKRLSILDWGDEGGKECSHLCRVSRAICSFREIIIREICTFLTQPFWDTQGSSLLKLPSKRSKSFLFRAKAIFPWMGLFGLLRIAYWVSKKIR